MRPLIDRLRSFAYDGVIAMRETTGEPSAAHTAAEGADKIELLQRCLRALIDALDAGHAPALEAYDNARAALSSGKGTEA